MKHYLLDTSTVVKWSQGEVPPYTKRQLLKGTSVLHVSILAPWEITIKPKFQKMQFTHEDVVEIVLNDLEAVFLPLQLNHLQALRTLPFFVDHNEAFDRMLVAQAMSEDFTLVGGDTRFPQYEKHGLKLLWD